jgi:cyclophilin family peptidyl-prolyl cis-trans isomerase
LSALSRAALIITVATAAMIASAVPPAFVTALPDVLFADGAAITIGIDVEDADSANVTVTAVTNDSAVEVVVPQGNRLGRFNFEEADGTPIGAIVVELFETRSGLSAARIINLATKNFEGAGEEIPGADPFYTDVVVHRVIPGFMMQTGDAVNGNGTGGSTLGPFDDQFELQDSLNFGRSGVLAMANSGANSNNSQIFFTFNPATHLNGAHMILGQVISGQEVMDFIEALETGANDLPVETPKLASVDIIENSQDGTLTIKPANDFLGKAQVTVTLDDGSSPPVEHVITVQRLTDEIGTLPFPNSGETLAVESHNDRLYVSYGNRGLSIFDIANPTAPQFLGNFDTPGTARNTAVHNYSGKLVAFVADTSGGLCVLDVTDPADITLLQLIPVGGEVAPKLNGNVYDVEISDTRIIFVAEDDGGVSTFDANNADAIDGIGARLARLDLYVGEPARARDIELNGTTAYISYQNFGIIALNASNPSDIGFSNVPFSAALAQPWGMALRGNSLFVAEIGAGATVGALSIYSVANALGPVLRSRLELTNLPWQVGGTPGMAIVGRFNGGVSFVNTADAVNPFIEFESFASSSISNSVVFNDHIFLGRRTAGVSVVDGNPLFDGEVSVTVGSFHVQHNDLAIIDLGEADEGGTPIESTFTIRNPGNDTLTVGSVDSDGDIVVTQQPATNIAPDGETTFSIRLPAEPAGLNTETLTFNTTDSNENPFTFEVGWTLLGNSAVSGTVWDDVNADGVFDADELGISGVVALIYRDDGDGEFEPNEGDPIGADVTTGSAGDYGFTGISGGNYWIDIGTDAAPLRHRVITAGPDPRLVIVPSGNALEDVNFGTHFPVVTLTAIANTVTEGTDTLSFRITRTGPMIGTLSIDYTVTGTANGDDFVLPGTVDIPDGESFADIEATLTNDDIVEPSETVTVSVDINIAYQISGPGTATVAIDDDDTTDLIATELLYTAGTFPAGTGFDLIDITIDNLGNDIAANVTFSAQIRFSEDMIWGNADDIVLAPDFKIKGPLSGNDEHEPGGRALVSIDAPAAVNQYVGVMLNTDAALAETDTTNNVVWSAAADVQVTPELSANAWRFEIAFAGADINPLQLGMLSDATDGQDHHSIDRITALPPNHDGFAYLTLDTFRAIDNMLAIAESATWRMTVVAKDTPLMLSWDPNEIPAGKQLVFTPLDDQDNLLLGQAVYGLGQANLTVETNVTRSFQIDYVGLTNDTFTVGPGWNFMSLPLEPAIPEVDAVLADAGRADSLLVGQVWGWQHDIMSSVNRMRGACGYWLYAREAAVLPVHGVRPVTGKIALTQGWNMIGTSDGIAIPPEIQSTVWLWQAGKFLPATVLLPGFGYWVFAETDLDIAVVVNQ